MEEYSQENGGFPVARARPLADGAPAVTGVLAVTGVHTDAGKTLAAAVLCAGLGAHYWKPVQAGTDPTTDAETVAALLGDPARVLPEAYRLQLPASPHIAAAAEGLRIDTSRLQLPPGPRPLVVEGAGGLLVPLADDLLLADVFAMWGAPLVLVVRSYLGCINHSLLTLEAVRARKLPLLGVVFNDCGRPADEATIERQGNAPVLGRLPRLTQTTPAALRLAFDQYLDGGALRQGICGGIILT